MYKLNEYRYKNTSKTYQMTKLKYKNSKKDSRFWAQNLSIWIINNFVQNKIKNDQTKLKNLQKSNNK